MDAKRIRNMEEFAAVAGISRPTVSKYFNDPESVRETTRRRIEEALERHEYRPNIYAVNQNRRLTKNVGVVVPFLADPFFAEIARMIERRIIEMGLSPTLYSSHGSPEIEVELLDHLRSVKPAGVLLAPLGRRMSNRAEIERFCRDVPTILFDSNLDGVGQAFVGSDNFSFVNLTVDHMIAEGRTPFFLEMNTPANPNAKKRQASYIERMEHHGMEPMIVGIDGEGWAFEEIGRAGAMRLIAERALPTDDIICSNDRLAIGVLSACYDSGLRVGREAGTALRIASHDDHPFARFTCPALTTAAHDYEGVTTASVDQLINLVEAGGSLPSREEILFPAHLVKRQSA